MSGLSRADIARLYVFSLAGLAFVLLGGWIYLFGALFSWLALGMSTVLSVVCAISRRFRLDFGKASIEVVDVAV
ncbi:hypothetical protein OFN25_33575, partial [Escherichia coli]|nr:hypothetical protein [Escherichia coli]